MNNNQLIFEKRLLNSIFQTYQPVTLKETPVSAAVMLMIVRSEQETPSIVITKRALTLPNYAGHYSLPGGIRDAGDVDLFATATREVQEELSIPPEKYQLIGQLDDFFDARGNLVRPYIVTIQKKDFETLSHPSEHEISEIYFFSFEKYQQLKEDVFLETMSKRHPSYAFKEGHVFIWGLTAAILALFFKILVNRNGAVFMPRPCL